VTAISRSPDKWFQRLPEFHSDPALKVAKGDVRDFSYPNGLFSHILHLAADTSVDASASRPMDVISSNLDGTLHTLKFSALSPGSTFMYVSSGAIYGIQPEELLTIDESYTGALDHLLPGAAYSESKRMSECICASFGRTSGISVKIARCWSFIGPGLTDDLRYAASSFFVDAQSGRPIEIRGDGKSIRSYLYAADMTTWLWTIFENGQQLRPYNVGSDFAITMKDLASTIDNVRAPPRGVNIRGGVSPSLSGRRYVPNIGRAKTELGLEVWTPLEEGIRRTWRWLSCHNGPA